MIVSYFPLFLTFFRLVAACTFVPFAILWGIPHSFTAACWVSWLIVIVGLTDYLDGMLARAYKSQSLLGALADPLADKLLVLHAAIAYALLGVLSLWPVMVFVSREIIVSTVRAYAAQIGKPIAVERVGKYKTFMQLVMITVLPIAYWYPTYIAVPISIVIWGAVVLSTVSCYHYCNQLFKK